MELTSRFGDRFRIAFLSKVISAVSGSILLVGLTRLLEPSQFGVLHLTLSILGIAMLLGKFGIPNSASRYISKFKETDPRLVSGILLYSTKLNLIVVLLVASTIFLSSPFISQVLEEDKLIRLLSVGTIFVIFSAADSYVGIITQGFEDIQASSILNICNNFIKTIFSLFFAALGFGAMGALSGYILGFFVSSSVGMYYIYSKYYDDTMKRNLAPNLRSRIIRYSVVLASTSAAHSIDDKIDTVLVGFFIGPIAVGYYTIAKRVVSVIETPASALGFSIAPSFEAMRSRGNKQESAIVYENALVNILSLYLPAGIGLFLVAQPSVHIIFGEQYSTVVPLLQILSIYLILRSINQVTGSGLDYLGRGKERAVALSLSAMLNVILNIILIPMMGVKGATIATVITYSIYTVTNIYIIDSELNIKTYQIAKKLSRSVVVSIVSMVPVFYVRGWVNGLSSLILVIAIGVASWTLLSHVTGSIDLTTFY